MPAAIEKLLTKKDLAELIGVSQRSVERYISVGELPQPIRLGRRLRWRRETIDAFLARRERQAEVASE